MKPTQLPLLFFLLFLNSIHTMERPNDFSSKGAAEDIGSHKRKEDKSIEQEDTKKHKKNNNLSPVTLEIVWREIEEMQLANNKRFSKIFEKLEEIILRVEGIEKIIAQPIKKKLIPQKEKMQNVQSLPQNPVITDIQRLKINTYKYSTALLITSLNELHVDE